MAIQFEDFLVSDLFDIYRGDTKYIRRYYEANPGLYPVYSASTLASSVAGWISSYDFDTDCLTWTTNGYAGHVIRRSGRFSCTRDVGVLVPKKDAIDRVSLDYFVPALSTAFQSAATGRFKDGGQADYTKIATKRAAQVFVSVPVDESGLPDVDAQDEIASRFQRIRKAQERLSTLADHMRALQITTPSIEGTSADFSIGELFDEPMRGNGGLDRRFIRSNPGPYPVYSGSSRRDEVIGHINSFSFSGPHLTWAADGYAGHVFARNGQFNANSHCGILKPRSDVADQLYLPFFEVFLTPLLLDIAVGRFKDDGSPDYTRVTSDMVKSVSITLPVDALGNPDRNRQMEVADRVLGLLRRRSEIIASLRRTSTSKVAVEGLEVA